ncbi:hypothetical protein [Cyclobacterium marinum]|uniref:hypothetical protein n=1 Tax=Cyclobacterium marinum TaxID=104 RepID=UPI0030D804F1
MDGFSFLDTISWDALNEGSYLSDYLENYRFYLTKGLADKIYCTRDNRKWLESKNILEAAKPLGFPAAKGSGKPCKARGEKPD